ncbi:MAG: class I tRNA ligase family protein [Opitutia bacterium]
MPGSFYITTAIDYANGAPHLGHAYEKVLADVIARHARMSGRRVHFLTGLDEHGQKVQQTAQKRGIAPQQLVDEVATVFREMLGRLSISNDDYIRTTEPRHRKVVQDFLQRLHADGLIFKDTKSGWYSVRQEQFLSDKDRDEKGEWPEIYGEVTQTTEENYYFRLSQFQPWLIEHIRANPDFILPRFRQNQVLEFLKQPMNDLCISRPKSRLTWGIELPFDTDFVTYVWFDALTNYYSAVVDKGLWPADLHVIGKDILSPPHAVYWPCMLKALGIEPPRRLLVHGWWTIDNKKASKSDGNATDSLSFARTHGADAFRYYLSREMVVGQDADFAEKTFNARYKADLSNSLGNLVNRLLNMVGRNCAGTVPAPAADEEAERSVRALWAQTRKAYDEAFAEHQVSHALDALWTFINALNAYIETRAPWKLAKSSDPADRARLDSCLAHVSEGLRLVGTALLPVMPGSAATMLEHIGQPVPDGFTAFDWSAAGSGVKVAEKCILFPQIEPPAPPAP